MRGQCSCSHSRAVHRNQRGRCLAKACTCLYAPPAMARRVEVGTRGTVTVDASGVVLDYQRPKPTPAQRIVGESDRRRLERRLWRELELAGLPLPDELEYQFARSIGRRWRSDGYYRAAQLLVEVDGGTWVQGRHNHPSGFEEDCRKLSAAAGLGYRVIRVTGAMIASGEAVSLIQRALQPAETML